MTLREQLEDVDSLSEELIDRIVNTFLEQVKDVSWISGGWPQTLTDYSVSKLAVNAYTRLLARILSDRPEDQKIYINCNCPGWVKTAMTGWVGHTSPEEPQFGLRCFRTSLCLAKFLLKGVRLSSKQVKGKTVGKFDLRANLSDS